MTKIETGFILAAGRGSRMRPLVDDCPKPLVRLHDRPILDYILDALKLHGVRKLVINAHYRAEQIVEYGRTHQSEFDSLEISVENELLETGGGLKQAAHLLGDQPFFMINGDAFWREDTAQEGSCLRDLESQFDAEKMDILLNLIDVEKMKLTEGVGDYDFVPKTPKSLEAKPIRRNISKQGAYMFTGIRIVHPRVLETMKEGAYSFLEQMDQAQAQAKLYGIPMRGLWHHISTPEDVEAINV
ncbi:MAG: nucleotidyltransferase family protein [Alphaproteobacteria bacterium]|nr:nucleotidyltransferase family protein [Alphaproteobacteria bacterium]